ncbi:unnamed protein product, partial [Meganyctiphanes norvegica]
EMSPDEGPWTITQSTRSYPAAWTYYNRCSARFSKFLPPPPSQFVGGYLPIPSVTDGQEFLLLCEKLHNMSVNTILLDTWYKRDFNALPFVYILLNLNNK